MIWYDGNTHGAVYANLSSTLDHHLKDLCGFQSAKPILGVITWSGSPIHDATNGKSLKQPAHCHKYTFVAAMRVVIVVFLVWVLSI